MGRAKQPERLCVGCRVLHPKNTLLRIARTPEGAIAFDPTGKRPGRGAYLCLSAECLRKARRQNGLSWSFKGRVAPAVYDSLEEIVQRGEDGT